MASHGRSIAILVIVSFGLLSVASAVEYTVGADTNGWKIPDPKSYYDDWIAGKKFTVGDVLVFQYTPLAHTVLHVSKADYENCVRTNPIVMYATGDDKVLLTTADDYYFICGATGHCANGQKFTITVSASSAGTPPSSKPPSASPVPTPAAASGLHAAGALVCSVLMVLVASLAF